MLAAAGANVTIYDNSPRQLERDRTVAQREGLVIDTVEGDIRDLHSFPDNSFDLVFHPVSNVFCPRSTSGIPRSLQGAASGRNFDGWLYEPGDIHI